MSSNRCMTGSSGSTEIINVVPSLAEYWVISADGRKYTFTLRKGRKFHHGREVTSDDVKFSLERLLRRETGVGTPLISCPRWSGRRPSGWERPPRSRVSGPPTGTPSRSNGGIPTSSGLYLLSMSFCKVLPRDLVTDQGRDFFKKPSGTGAFRFGYWLRDSSLAITGVHLERNRDYFGETAYLDAVEYSPFFTTEQFLRGEVHIIPLESEDLASGRYPVLENNSLDVLFLTMTCNIPPLDTKEVRQALAFALDKRKLARAYSSVASQAQVVHNYIPADLPGFFPLEGPSQPNLGRAGALLAEAGFPGGKGFPELTLGFLLPRRRQHIRLHQELRTSSPPWGSGSR